MDAILLSGLGFLLTAILLFLIIKHLEAAIFWAALCAPAIGASIVNCITLYFSGDTAGAIESLKFLPFFVASLDATFFASENIIYYVVGVLYLVAWAYIFAHYGIKKFGMWALPLVPIILFGVGLTLPNLRAVLTTTFPNMAFMFTFYGVPFLALISGLLFVACYLVWRSGYTVKQLPWYVPREKVKGTAT